MKYNLTWIMRRAWSLHREKGFTLATSLRLAWREAKGEKGYTFNLENARASISSYLMKLAHQLHGSPAGSDIHDEHKYSILRGCLMAPVDSMGLSVLTGKEVGLCKYAMRNA